MSRRKFFSQCDKVLQVRETGARGYITIELDNPGSEHNSHIGGNFTKADVRDLIVALTELVDGAPLKGLELYKSWPAGQVFKWKDEIVGDGYIKIDNDQFVSISKDLLGTMYTVNGWIYDNTPLIPVKPA